MKAKLAEIEEHIKQILESNPASYHAKEASRKIRGLIARSEQPEQTKKAAPASAGKAGGDK